MTPIVGEVVHYELTEQDAEAINRRRKDASSNLGALKTDALGYVVHVGNHAEAGQVFGLTVTRVWGPSVINGQLTLDGNDSFWKTSVTEATGVTEAQTRGRWFWPPRD